MEFRDHVRTILRRWPVVVAAVALALVVTVISQPSPSESPADDVTEYTVVSTLVRSTDGLRESTISLPLLARLAQTGEVTARVQDRLANTYPEAVPSTVRVEADASLDILTLTYAADTEAEAEDVVAGFVEELLAYAAERNEVLRLSSVDRLRALTTEQQNRVRELNLSIEDAGEDTTQGQLLAAERDALLVTYSSNLRVLEELNAQRAEDPGLTLLGEPAAFPTRTRDIPTVPTSLGFRAAWAMLGGLLLGAILALVLERVDGRLHRREDFEKALGVPVVGVVPLGGLPLRRLARATTGAARQMAFAVSRGVVWHVAINATTDGPKIARTPGAPLEDSRGRVIVVAPTAPREDLGSLVIQLALGLVADGQRVTMVVPSTLRPRLQEEWGFREFPASGPRDPGPTPTGVPRLMVDVIEPSDTVHRPHERHLYHCDVVLVLVDALQASAEAARAATEADAVLLVATLHGTTREQAANVLRTSVQLDLPLAGLGLIRRRPLSVPRVWPAPVSDRSAPSTMNVTVAGRGGSHGTR